MKQALRYFLLYLRPINGCQDIIFGKEFPTFVQEFRASDAII